MKLRIVTVLGGLVWLVLVGRLLDIQLDRVQYLELAEAQHKCTVFLPAKRGRVFDRNHKSLAINIVSHSFAADPSVVKDPVEVVDRFARIVPEKGDLLLTRLQAERSFVWLVRNTDHQIAEKIRSWSLPGVFEQTELKRYYPLGHSLGQLLGYTDTDNVGIEGIEFSLNAFLEGKSGFMISQRDGKGKLHPEVHSVRVAPQDGNDVILTVDATYQMIAEEELEATVKDFDALSGVAILMNPKTAQILALVHYPFCDPNHPTQHKPEFRKNRSITDVYEPGSTFKTVAACAAIERDLFALEDSIFCENGKMVVAGSIIRDVHEYGWLTFKEVIAHSSNIGMIKVADRLGKASLYHQIRDFGFGNKAGIELLGEVEGILHHPSAWSKRSLATIAIGQEISVTPLQLANAYSGIANKGRLMRPYIVSKVINKDGKVIKENKPLYIRRVVSESTAEMITDCLISAVEEGTGTKAQIEGLRVAGKTGTAQKPRSDGRGYEPGAFISSFVGFLPAEDPKLLCLVIVDTPKGLHWGSEVAAPTFKRIVDRILSLESNPIQQRERGIFVEQNRKKEDWVIVPDVRGYLTFDAKHILVGYQLIPLIQGDGRRVTEQSIAPGKWVKWGTSMALTTQEAVRDSTQRVCVVPDVSGMSLRRAVAVLAASDLNTEIRGSGMVKKQHPAKGTRVNTGTVCVLQGNRSSPLAEHRDLHSVRFSSLE